MQSWVHGNSMKVHSVPRKQDISIQSSVDGENSTSETQVAGKKLQRLPHVFSRVTDGIADVRVHTVETHPGMTKIVVREGGSVDQLELHMQRFRLPGSTPELVSAVVANGQLIVTVPKEHKEEHGSRC
uniref:SHSP domain-containing protein n=2 Tax=Cajanus cajan TaxID=3821 RepID=A0A151U756_CAJCA|nr:hypothetical protein KK1_007820 [Cajanus cajan]